MANAIKRKTIKIFNPIYLVISLISLVISVIIKLKDTIKNKDMYISLCYIVSLISGLIFIDKNIKPIDKDTFDNDEEEEDLEMEVELD